MEGKKKKEGKNSVARSDGFSVSFWFREWCPWFIMREKAATTKTVPAKGTRRFWNEFKDPGGLLGVLPDKRNFLIL
jgi:hypothetical protein